MPFANSTTRQSFPFGFDDVYDGLIEVLPKQGFLIKDHDKELGANLAGSHRHAKNFQTIIMAVSRSLQSRPKSDHGDASN